MADDAGISTRLRVLESPLAAAPTPLIAPQGPALVLGGTGQIGLFAIRRLLDAGASVIAHYCHRQLPYTHPNLTWFQWDMAGPAPQLSPCHTVIAATALWLLPPALEALHAAGARRVLAFSSSSVITKEATANPAEQHTIAALRQAELAFWSTTAALDIRATLFRPTLIYGAGLDQNVEHIRRVIRRLRFFPIYKGATGLRQPVHADDLALAALQAASHPTAEGQTYFLSGGETLTYRRMVERTFEREHLPPRLLNLPLWPALMDAASKVTHSRFNGEMFRRMALDMTFDHQPAARDFGYSPRPFRP